MASLHNTKADSPRSPHSEGVTTPRAFLVRVSLACLLALVLPQPLQAESAFEMYPAPKSSLPEPQPLDIVKGVPVFSVPSPSPSASPSAKEREPGSGKVEVRAYSTTTPDYPIETSAIYRASTLPKTNNDPATEGHHRTLVGFYAVHPTRDSIAPRRIRFEITLEAPGSAPQSSVIEMNSPPDGKIRAIPAHISLPINRQTRPGKYTVSWVVRDQESGDWDGATASFAKANVEKIADVDANRPTPPSPTRPAPSDGFSTKPPPPARPKADGQFAPPPAPEKRRNNSESFVTTPLSSEKRGESHQGFRTKGEETSPRSRPTGFDRPRPTPKPKKTAP